MAKKQASETAANSDVTAKRKITKSSKAKGLDPSQQTSSRVPEKKLKTVGGGKKGKARAKVNENADSSTDGSDAEGDGEVKIEYVVHMSQSTGGTG